MVTREKLLSFGKKRRFKTISVNGLGQLKIRSLKEAERSAYEAERFHETGEINENRIRDSKARLISLCVCDDNGEPLLTPDDVTAITEQDGAFTGYLFDECWQHCGFSRKDIETIVGNLSTIPDADSH